MPNFTHDLIANVKTVLSSGIYIADVETYTGVGGATQYGFRIGSDKEISGSTKDPNDTIIDFSGTDVANAPRGLDCAPGVNLTLRNLTVLGPPTSLGSPDGNQIFKAVTHELDSGEVESQVLGSLRLENVKIRSAGDGIKATRNIDLYVTDCDIESAAACILGGGSIVEIKDSRFSSDFGTPWTNPTLRLHGIYLLKAIEKVQIKNCVFQNIGQWSIQFYNPETSAVVVENCLFVDCNNGIVGHELTAVKVSRCYFDSPQGVAVGLRGGGMNLDSCIFSSLHGTGSGEAIVDVASVEHLVSLENCTFLISPPGSVAYAAIRRIQPGSQRLWIVDRCSFLNYGSDQRGLAAVVQNSASQTELVFSNCSFFGRGTTGEELVSQRAQGSLIFKNCRWVWMREPEVTSGATMTQSNIGWRDRYLR